jgi:hypothetical protein
MGYNLFRYYKFIHSKQSNGYSTVNILFHLLILSIIISYSSIHFTIKKNKKNYLISITAWDPNFLISPPSEYWYKLT